MAHDLRPARRPQQAHAPRAAQPLEGAPARSRPAADDLGLPRRLPGPSRHGGAADDLPHRARRASAAYVRQVVAAAGQLAAR